LSGGLLGQVSWVSRPEMGETVRFLPMLLCDSEGELKSCGALEMEWIRIEGMI